MSKYLIVGKTLVGSQNTQTSAAAIGCSTFDALLHLSEATYF